MILIKDCYYYQRKNQRCKEKGRYFTAEIKKIVERYYNLFYLKIFLYVCIGKRKPKICFAVPIKN